MRRTLGALALGACTLALAQVETVVVTATRSSQSTLEIPASIDRIYGDEIREGRLGPVDLRGEHPAERHLRAGKATIGQATRQHRKRGLSRIAEAEDANMRAWPNHKLFNDSAPGTVATACVDALQLQLWDHGMYQAPIAMHAANMPLIQADAGILVA